MSVVVTGMGVVAPTGLGLDRYWAATLRGESGIRRIRAFDPDRYPTRHAGEVTGFDPADHLPSRLVPQTDRMTQFALAAADWAVADAAVDLDAIPPLERGVVTASSSGGFGFGQRELQHLWGESPKKVSAYMSFAWFYAVNTGQISIRHGLSGPTGVHVAEQAGGLDVIAHARRQIRSGTRLMLAGGTDCSLCPYGMAAQLAGGRLSTAAYRPFDRRASGHLPGEGGAMLVLENAGHARERSRRPYGEIAGFGSTFDPRPGSGRPPTLRRAVEQALADARTDPGEIALVLADGAGLPGADAAEATVLTEVFGPRGVPVTVPKTGTGRLYSGAGPLDVVTALLALRDGVAPPTVGVDRVPEAYGLDLVTDRPRPVTGTAALVLARGHHGFNSALVVRSADRAVAAGAAA
ncbi:ketosynthase chain-length factor [Streptomyces sp. SID8374]|uniref:ketosynthase chain-length factor n=1 Tax=Streptomyces sp. SID8374 TaxID=2690354 RepID=UPI00137001EF|nr:ketosynthase chain-length factor [Streptomyces sp. SID8374]MYX17141.1 ketosynthase chain-length factor [Streptomyces sp. SID8374]